MVKAHPMVLVVEDDTAVVKVLRLSLKSGGFETAAAESGGEALAVMDGSAFDAVVLDLGLPDGRGGDVLRRLQLRQSSPVWVVMSALDEDEAIRRYGPIKGPFLPKPFDPWELMGIINGLLAKGGPKSSRRADFQKSARPVLL